jgi:hypothetical protein
MASIAKLKGWWGAEGAKRVSPRHCERSEAIHLSAHGDSGLLHCARNDGGYSFAFFREDWWVTLR